MLASGSPAVAIWLLSAKFQTWIKPLVTLRQSLDFEFNQTQ